MLVTKSLAERLQCPRCIVVWLVVDIEDEARSSWHANQIEALEKTRFQATSDARGQFFTEEVFMNLRSPPGMKMSCGCRAGNPYNLRVSWSHNVFSRGRTKATKGCGGNRAVCAGGKRSLNGDRFRVVPIEPSAYLPSSLPSVRTELLWLRTAAAAVVPQLQN